MKNSRIKPSAVIISTNANGFDITAAACRLSRHPDTAIGMFERSAGNPKNGRLVENVLSYGHESVIEHITLTIAFDNVSLAFEQFMISHRLASFTVKSRRSVNFEDVGYHIPIELEGNDLAGYKEFMDDMFARYSGLVKLGIPLEDARYVLPYATHSSFYCTLNLRELIHILEDISKYGREYEDRDTDTSDLVGIDRTRFHKVMVNWTEGQEIRNDIITQLTSMYPDLAAYVVERVSDPGHGYMEIGELIYGINYDFKLGVFPANRCGKVSLISTWPGKEYDIDPVREMSTQCGLLWKGYPARYDARRLEMSGFLSRIENISLAALTHLTRHRTQSLKYGDLPSLRHERFIIPDSIAKSDAAWEIYDGAAMAAMDAFTVGLVGQVNEMYTLLAGSLTFAYVSMNLREFIHFVRLRACNRAQWEIRTIANNMLEELDGVFGIVDHIGPPCAMDGRCDQGRIPCGNPHPLNPNHVWLDNYQRNVEYGV